MSDSNLYILGIVGVRDKDRQTYSNSAYIRATLDAHVEAHNLDYASIKVVTGGSKGVDAIVIAWCNDHSIPYVTIPPDIDGQGFKDAFIVRNKQIVDASQEVILFWDAYTSTFMDSIKHAIYSSKKVTVFPVV